MKKIYTLLFLMMFSGMCVAQCVNADFSLGNFTNWTGSVGTYSATNGVYSSTGPMVVGTQNSNTYATDIGRQTIITDTSLTDPETQNVLKETPPGGGYSCRLGNPRTGSCDGGSAQEEQLAYTYTVTSANFLFTCQYAVVLHDPGAGANHTEYTRPKFSIEVLNSSGAVVDSVCGIYSVIAQPGNPGFISCSADANDACDYTDDVVWKNWATSSFDLSSYIGQSITILFDTRDCNPSGSAGKHFGYAYISCSCGSLSLTQQCAGTSDIVSAPVGFSSYQWTYINSLGTTVTTTTTTNSITINPVPNGHPITCVMVSVTGCTVTLTLPLSVDIPVFTPNASMICSGQTATITATPATYDYSWNTGQIGASISVEPITTTIYTVTATAAGGCSSSASVTVNVNPLPIGTTTSTVATCGNNNGTITVSPSFNAYLWSTNPAQTTQTATGLAPGTYTVTITDANGCTSAISGVISSNSNIAASVSSTPEYCGMQNGTAKVTPMGGTGTYTYSWNTTPAQTTQTALNLSAGAYAVTVTDGSCVILTNVSISSIPGPSVQFSNVTNASCGLNNGSATASGIGGTPPYQYTWNTMPQQTTPILVNVPAGNYCITVTDVNGCTATNCASIGVEAYPAPDICMVTIDTATNHNLIIWGKPVTSGIDKYYIYRESAVAGIYNLIGTQNYSVLSTYLDTSSNPTQQSYRYELAIHDTCNLTSMQSNYHQTIHLSLSSVGNAWNLNWNNYVGFTFSTYNIYRGTSKNNLTLLTSVSSNNTSFTDLAPPSGFVYYLVEAVDSVSCNPSKTTNNYSATISNIASNNGSGISEFNENNFINISPNPSNGTFTLTLQNFPTQDLEIEIFNSLGQRINKDVLNTQTKTIDISSFPKGIYFLKISFGEKYVFKKIITE